MTYSVPSPVNASYVKKRYGRSKEVYLEVGAIAEKPTFVDNTIHHAIYETTEKTIGDNFQVSLSKKTQVSKPNQGDFQPTHQRRYRLSEEQSSIRLAHKDHEDAPFFNGEQLSESSSRPMLLIADNDTSLRLRTQSLSNTQKGVRVNLNNMKGKSLADYSMDSVSHVRAGQTISVGMRSTDLVEKLFDKALHGLNSVSAQGVSTLFVAQNFNSTVIPTAVRFVGRHDHFIMYYDRFGNFLYAPKIFNNKDRELGTQRGVAKTKIDPIVDVANRMVVKGNGIAVNDNISVVVDDAEEQKKRGSIKEMKMKDPTVNNESKARTSASQLLRLNKKAQGALQSNAHAQSWDFEPGDIVNYKSAIGNVQQAIIELAHKSDGTSDFQMISYEAGLEAVVNSFGDSADLDDEEFVFDNSQQISSINKSGIGSAKIRVRGVLRVRPVITKLARIRTGDDGAGSDIHAGMLLGHRNSGYGAGRSALGFGITPRINGTHALGAITVATTAGFADSGFLILDNKSFVLYSGRTATTFTGVILVSGAAIASPIAEIRMLRPRGHEMRTVKGKKIRRKI
tara:strand:- start:362 stop:2059 length:1698 start_codon:yes stop_codon:yes gene_type:complete